MSLVARRLESKIRTQTQAPMSVGKKSNPSGIRISIESEVAFKFQLSEHMSSDNGMDARTHKI